MDVLVAVALGSFLAGVGCNRLMHWRWRTMYAHGEAECWRCHGSGREGR